jgi:hypothetical protein
MVRAGCTVSLSTSAWAKSDLCSAHRQTLEAVFYPARRRSSTRPPSLLVFASFVSFPVEIDRPPSVPVPTCRPSLAADGRLRPGILAFIPAAEPLACLADEKKS